MSVIFRMKPQDPEYEYVTSDGRVFNEPPAAEKHESALTVAMLCAPENQEVLRLAAYLSDEGEDWDGCTLSERELFQELLGKALLARKYNPTSA